jgi:hypothetical protein
MGFSGTTSSRYTQRLVLSSKNVNKNTGLFHLAGIELAPPAQSETLSKSLEVLFLGSNLFFRERWFDKRQERQCVKAFCVRCKTLAGDGTEPGEGDHFSKCFATGSIILRCRTAAPEGQTDQEGLTYRSPCGVSQSLEELVERTSLSLPKIRFEHSGGVVRQGLDTRQCRRTVRRAVRRAHPYRAKRGSEPHCNRSRISRGFAEGARR